MIVITTSTGHIGSHLVPDLLAALEAVREGRDNGEHRR
jgi:hypothetical protein